MPLLMIIGILRSDSFIYLKEKNIDDSLNIAKEEFRKNVTLTTKATKPIAIKVEDLYEFLDKTKNFVHYVNSIKK